MRKIYSWGELISLEYGKPVSDKESINAPVPVYGTNGQIGTSFQKPLCSFPSFIIGRKGAYRGVHYSKIPFSVIDTAFYVAPKSSELNLKWAYYKFLTYNINSMDSGSAIPSTDRYEIYGIKTELPSLGEQIKVATLLTDIDDKIELNAQINQNLEAQAKAIWSAWSDECTEFTTVGEVADNILDFSPNKHERVVLVNSGDVHLGHFTHHALSFNENLKGHFKKRFSKGDILYSEIRPLNRHFAYVSFDATHYIASTRLMVVRNKPDKIHQSLLYQFLKTDEAIEAFASMTDTRSGTFPQGNFADLSKLVLPIQSFGKQAKIAGVFDNILSRIAQNDEESCRLAVLRDTLLPKLMSGEIDVSEVAI